MDIKALHALLTKNHDLLEKIIHKDIYRYQRYDVPFSIAIFHSTHPKVAQTLLKSVRETDEVIPIDDNFNCVVFGFVTHENAYTAAKNTLYQLQKEHPNDSFSAGLTSVNHMDEVKDMVFRAIRNLHYAMKEKESAVEDDSVIDFIVLH